MIELEDENLKPKMPWDFLGERWRKVTDEKVDVINNILKQWEELKFSDVIDTPIKINKEKFYLLLNRGQIQFDKYLHYYFSGNTYLKEGIPTLITEEEGKEVIEHKKDDFEFEFSFWEKDGEKWLYVDIEWKESHFLKVDACRNMWIDENTDFKHYDFDKVDLTWFFVEPGKEKAKNLKIIKLINGKEKAFVLIYSLFYSLEGWKEKEKIKLLIIEKLFDDIDKHIKDGTIDDLNIWFKYLTYELGLYDNGVIKNKHMVKSRIQEMASKLNKKKEENDDALSENENYKKNNWKYEFESTEGLIEVYKNRLKKINSLLKKIDDFEVLKLNSTI